MLLKAWKVACVNGHTGMLLRNISLNIAKNPCLTRVFVAWHHGVKTCIACAQVDVLAQFLEPLKSGTKGNFWLQNSCQTGYFSNFSHLVLYDPRPHAPKAQTQAQAQRPSS